MALAVLLCQVLTECEALPCSVSQSCPTLCGPAHQASLSITNSRSLLKLMSTESVLQGTILRGSGYSFN